MSADSSYWTRIALSRRAALRGAAAMGGGAVALGLVGCGGGDDDAGSGGGTRSGATSGELDYTKGKPGGTLAIQTNNFPANFDFVTSASGARVAGFSYSSLVAFKGGRAGIDPASLEVEPDVAAALPEQPNDLTFIFKLRPDVKFHNGRTLTAEDVKYSLDLYNSDKSAHKDSYTWLDKVEATDATTLRITTKQPYADTVINLVGYQHPFIFSKEHFESPAAAEKMMGTGPFLHASTQAPVSVTFRRNPDYFMKPLPHFDGLTFNVITDTPKQVADFLSKQIHFTWYATPEFREQIVKGRPDARMTQYENFGQCLYIRCDQTPFNDKRVRQAMSMTIDRKQLRDGVFEGEGEDDQAFSQVLKYWGARKPGELKSAKNWKYDPAEGKKLFAAAGLTSAKEWNMTVASTAANTQILQQGELINARWKELGVGSLKFSTQQTTQFQNTVGRGNYDDLAMFHNQMIAIIGIYIKNRYWSPPEGVKAPTTNVGYVNNPEMSRLLDKQLGQFKIEERRASFRDVEEILGDEQYRITLSTAKQAWFLDPTVKNAEVFSWSSNSTVSHSKYWWFDHA